VTGEDNHHNGQTVVIPSEEAVFWLDSRGYWRNSGGQFRKKKIIDYFHAAIARDANGYHLYQQKGEGFEKVYFPFEDTALFVFEVVFLKDGITLVLNTGRRLKLTPRSLYSKNDCLYLMDKDELIKFSERALMQIAPLLEEHGNGFGINCGGQWHPIAER